MITLTGARQLIGQARKTLAAAAAGAAFVVAAGLVHGQALVIASAIIAVAGAAGVYVVPNGARQSGAHAAGSTPSVSTDAATGPR